MSRTTIVAGIFLVLALVLAPASASANAAPPGRLAEHAAAQGGCESPYVVRAGDNLTRIARRCGTTVEALRAANGLSGDLIRAGQRLTIPGAPAATPVPGPLEPKVVIAVVDGWRYEDTYGDPAHGNIPRIWNELRPQGAWYSRIYNLGETQTAAGHAAILSGAWQTIANDGTGRPTAPTVFEYYRKATGAPASDAALVFSGPDNGKAAHWAYSTAPGYGAAYGARLVHAEGLDLDDLAVLDLALGALADHPHLVVIAFPAVDEFGHGDSYEAYLDAIRTADTAIWRLWNALQGDPFYAGQTTLFVTSDHGRRLDDFHVHGGTSDSERHVTLLALGPRTPAGLHVAGRRTLTQIAPTAGRILGFSTPLAHGGVLWEALRPN